jgi:hypothetical protein
MNSLKDYIIEASEKISLTGKKKLDKQVDAWLKNIKAFMNDYGFCAEDDYYQEIENIVWNYVNDENIVSWSSKDRDTVSYIEDKIMLLSNEVEKSKQ